MKDLTKQMFFENNEQTSIKAIHKLANDLLDLTWSFDVYRNHNTNIINLRKLGWTFEFNNRKASLGLCNSRKKVIYVSQWFLNQNLEKSLEFEDTIRHEIAHALDYEFRGTSDHSKVWKCIAKQVLANPERTARKDAVKVTETTKYTLTCPNCERVVKRHKKPSPTMACGDCCRKHNRGRYSIDYVFKKVQNY